MYSDDMAPSASKRQKTGRNAKKGKGKGKAPPPPPPAAPEVAETLGWQCPVTQCKRDHWSERVVTAGVSVWKPMKDTGAIKVFA